MKINKIIKERRIAKNYTQEQIANYLGVTTPAVNKWEKGTSYPDITLLPALARLLDTDLNTLLSFQDDLSNQEIAIFLNSLSDISNKEGIDQTFHIAENKIKQFPTCYSLILNTATFLDGLLTMNKKANNQKDYIEYIESLYSRVLEGPDSMIKNQAKATLISKYIAKGNYKYAQTLLDSLPEQDYFDKKQIQINLFIASHQLDKAEQTAEEKLLTTTFNLQNSLLSLMEIALKQNRLEDAKYIADVSKNTAKLYDLWSYQSYIANFQFYVETKQHLKASKVVIPMLKSLNQKWNINQSPLYRHIKTKEIDKNFVEKTQKIIIDNIFNEKETAYLKDNPEINALLKE